MGVDGTLNVQSGTFNMHTQASNGRGCADAISYRVSTLTSNSVTLTTTPPSNCLAAGDEVLLIAVQGRRDVSTGAHYANVGNYETLRVQSVSTSTVTFTAAKRFFYGDVAGDDTPYLGLPLAYLQRVPNYAAVNVDAGATLTGRTWDNSTANGGGILFFRASGSVVVQGTISMDGAGYSGGRTPAVAGQGGFQGESRCGVINSANASFCTYGGGYGGTACAGVMYTYALSGGGGALGTPGTPTATADCLQPAGRAYGTMPLRLHLGSGGGGGANPPVASVPAFYGKPGGNGGGAIVIFANAINVSGRVSANGAAGGDATACGTQCFHVAGAGGGGSGGAIMLGSLTPLVGGSLVHVDGAAGGASCVAYTGCTDVGGHGGQGELIIP